MLLRKMVTLFLALSAAVGNLSGVARAGGAEAVVLEVEADSPVLEAGKAQKVVVRVLARPNDEGKRREMRRRAPLAVALVLDKSGSMGSDGKIENARRGALEALRVLGARDVATVVAYDDRASVLVRARTAGDESAFAPAISRIRPGGSTALYDGVRLGAKQLEPFVKEGYVPRIVLLSDGLANIGPSSAGALAELGRALARQEMTITTIGLGLDYNEDLMTALAAESGGNAYFAERADSLPEIFARDMGDAVSLTARKVRVTLNCRDGVRPLGALGRSGKTDGQSVEVSVDNLYGAEKYALFEVEVPERDAEGILDAATARVEYSDALTGETVVREAPLKLVFTRDVGEAEKHRKADIVAQTAIAKNAELREEVVRLADEGRSAEASDLLKQRTEELKQLAPAAGAAAPKMAAEAQEFNALADDLEREGKFSSSRRKEALNKAYIQKNQQAVPDDADE